MTAKTAAKRSNKPLEEMTHEELIAKLDRVILRLAKAHAAVKS
jgi:hypothetical protein